MRKKKITYAVLALLTLDFAACNRSSAFGTEGRRPKGLKANADERL